MKYSDTDGTIYTIDKVDEDLKNTLEILENLGFIKIMEESENE